MCVQHCLLGVCCISLLLLPSTSLAFDSLRAEIIVLDLEKESHELLLDFAARQAPVKMELSEVNQKMHQVLDGGEVMEDLCQLIAAKMTLEDGLEKAQREFQLDLTKLRYKKGLELIQLLYEKILGLDYHFTSLKTHQSVLSISNPNAFPEFQRAQETIEKRLQKNHAMNLPSLLHSNPYLSTTFTLFASILGNGNTQEKEKELEDVSCILDFSARMHAELTTIYYETGFLHETNKGLKEECIQLFSDYTEVIGYDERLESCRAGDNWDKVQEAVNALFQEIEAKMLIEDELTQNWAYKQQINLEFSIDRLLGFIDKYASFIGQGEKYYHKFELIINNYPNEAICASKLPSTFADLKKDIQVSISKFNEAYNISALRGSKLRDLLYGAAE